MLTGGGFQDLPLLFNFQAVTVRLLSLGMSVMSRLDMNANDGGDVGDLELLGDDARFRLHCISSCEVAALLSGKTAMSRSPP